MASIIDIAPSRPSEQGAPVPSFVRRARQWLHEASLNLLHLVGAPGVIRAMRCEDPVTGQSIQVRVDKRFTVLSVNGRDYYFRRITGKLYGAGTGQI